MYDLPFESRDDWWLQYWQQQINNNKTKTNVLADLIPINIWQEDDGLWVSSICHVRKAAVLTAFVIALDATDALH